MNRRVLEALTSWPYLLCLFVLLLNDCVLKSTYPGFLTGKLSDFAGVVVVALPLFAIIPTRAPLIYGGIICVFLWWKSPASSGFIELVNSLGNIHFGRTVDYSDLFAILVLPLCHAIANSLQNYLLPWHRYRKIIAFPIGIITILAVLGTSLPPSQRGEYTIRSNSTTQELSHDYVAEVIKAVALKHGLKCHDCSHPNEGASYNDNVLSMEYSFPGSNLISFRISAHPSDRTFGLFGSSSEEKLDALSRSLKKEFSTRFRDMEYVEQLSIQPR